MKFLHCPRNGEHSDKLSKSEHLNLLNYTVLMRSKNYGAVGIVNEVI